MAKVLLLFNNRNDFWWYLEQYSNNGHNLVISDNPEMLERLMRDTVYEGCIADYNFGINGLESPSGAYLVHKLLKEKNPGAKFIARCRGAYAEEVAKMARGHGLRATTEDRITPENLLG